VQLRGVTWGGEGDEGGDDGDGCEGCEVCRGGEYGMGATVAIAPEAAMVEGVAPQEARAGQLEVAQLD
jgi:hypothetical protein